jgi:hypothetical protein
MLELPAHRIESAGVDWLTATAHRSKANEPFYELGKQLIEDNARMGNDLSNWKAQGYHGLKSGGVRVGLRHDTFICQLSSDDAREMWMPVAKLATNITRIDLQVTFNFLRRQKRFFHEEWKRATGSHTGRGRKSNVTLITSTLSGDSIYLGQRSSDVYARCYDKGVESKTEASCKVVRHEIELKRDAAKRTAARLMASPSPESLALSLVARHMRTKQLRTPGAIELDRESARARQTTDNDRRLRWLGSAVAPSVAVLLQAGRLDDVLSALGLTEACQAWCSTLQHRKDDRDDA